MAEDSINQEEPLYIENGKDIKGYTVKQKIDEGNFGQVFQVTKNAKTYAMKVEPNRSSGAASAIKVEIETLTELQTRNVKFVTGITEGGRTVKLHYLVMDLLGDNLKTLRSKSPNPNNATPSTWSRVGIQCLYVLKTIHDCGYVHRDLKPANYAMGPAETVNSRVLHMLDFGISRKFVKLPDGAQTNTVTREFRLARKRTKGFKGTPVYASPNAHDHMDLGRVDDLWSLMYMVAEMAQELPWGGLENEDLVKAKKAAKLKKLFKVEKATEKDKKDKKKEQLWDKSLTETFEAIERMLRKNNFYSFPDYEMIYKAFKTVFDRCGASWLDPFDWETDAFPPYVRWKALALARTSQFPWEVNTVTVFFRNDPWNYLQKDIFAPSKELATEDKTKSKKKKMLDGETMTAEAMTCDEAKTPTPMKTAKKPVQLAMPKRGKDAK